MSKCTRKLDEEFVFNRLNNYQNRYDEFLLDLSHVTSRPNRNKPLSSLIQVLLCSRFITTSSAGAFICRDLFFLTQHTSFKGFKVTRVNQMTYYYVRRALTSSQELQGKLILFDLILKWLEYFLFSLTIFWLFCPRILSIIVIFQESKLPHLW